MPKSRTPSVDVWATRTGAATTGGSGGKWVERKEAKQKLHAVWKADLGHQVEAIQKLQAIAMQEYSDEAVYGSGNVVEVARMRDRPRQVEALQKRYRECLARFIQLEIELGYRKPKKNKGKAAPAPAPIQDVTDLTADEIKSIMGVSEEALEIAEEQGVEIALECLETAAQAIREEREKNEKDYCRGARQ